MKNLSLLFLTVLLSLSTAGLWAQHIENADTLFKNKEWVKAEVAYKQSLKKNTSDSSAWYKLGLSQMQLSKYAEAAESLNTAKENNYPIQFVTYNLAKTHALSDQKEKTLEVLEEAVKNGLAAYKQLESDTAFAKYKNLNAFQSIVKQAKENFYPCLGDPNFRHFDFWIGEWDVFVNGRKVGENSIILANGGCAIHESYTTPRGYSGQSINYYDKKDKKWHQTWVGSSGGVLDYIEIDREEGMLQFQCEFLSPRGIIQYSRLTFTKNDDGSVRQFFENSNDNETWTPGFDGHYIKKEN